MPNYNKVLLMGNLTRDVELRAAGSTQVGNFGLAVNRNWIGQDGQKHEEVTFVDCESWGKTAENMAKFFSKGRPVFIEGRLKLDQWEKDGQKHSKIRVVVETFQFVDSKPGGGGGGNRGGSSDEPESGWAKTRSSSSSPSQASEPAPAEDIPF